jgi:hypothetical protein
MKSRRICIYGNSVILGTLGLNLRRCPQYEVTSLIPPFPEDQVLADLKPDVIFFDIESHSPKAAFALLETLPDLLLIGISPDSNLVKTWTGRQLHELSVQDLLNVINDQIVSGRR